jgi:hypothetical protein
MEKIVKKNFNIFEGHFRLTKISIELEDFPEELARCSRLLYIFECLFNINLYTFFA